MTHQELLKSALKTLNHLSVGQEAWCWMHRGEADRAALVVVPRTRDPKGATFLKRVTRVREGRPGVSAQGILRRLPSGALSLIVRRQSDTAVGIHAALCRSMPAGRMPDLLVVCTRDGAVSETRAAVNLSRQSAFLAGLAAGERGAFYLMTGEQLAAPRLMVAAERDTLRGLVAAEKQTLRRRGTTIHGQLRRSPSGTIEFRTRSSADTLRAALSAWAARHGDHWPTLSTLHTARVASTDRAA